jgi:hypothetical protein
MAVLAGIDFFTAEVLTWRGLTTYYVPFVTQLETRRVTIAGVTPHPNEEWMERTTRNLTDADSGALVHQRGSSMRRPLKSSTLAVHELVARHLGRFLVPQLTFEVFGQQHRADDRFSALTTILPYAL